MAEKALLFTMKEKTSHTLQNRNVQIESDDPIKIKNTTDHNCSTICFAPFYEIIKTIQFSQELVICKFISNQTVSLVYHYDTFIFFAIFEAASSLLVRCTKKS